MDSDNNIQTTVGSPIEWYKLEIMRDLVNLKEAWEHYSKMESSGVQVTVDVIFSRTRSLFMSCGSYLKRKDAVTHADMKKKLYINKTKNESELLEIFWTIQEQLDKDQILRIDLRKSYDSTNAETENKIMGLS